MKFEIVEPEDLNNFRESHRGRVSYPLLKSFMELTDKQGQPVVMAKLDRTGMQQTTYSLNSSLTAYIRGHSLPIKVFIRKGELHLLRLDLTYDEDGKVVEIPDWNEIKAPEGSEPALIDETEVAKRFAEERGQVTK